MKRHRSSSLHYLAAAIAILLPIAASSTDTRDIEKHLRDQYVQKLFILRGFYSGHSLHVDTSGNPVKSVTAGDWTLDGTVRLDDLSISGGFLKLRASRVYWGWFRDSGFQMIHDLDSHGKPDKNEKKSREVKIEADLGPGNPTADAAEAAFWRVFLSSHDSLVDKVPAYWKSCLRSALRHDARPFSCHVSDEFLSIPGVASQLGAEGNSTNSAVRQANSAEPRISTLRPGIKPPRATYSPEPEFTDSARKARFQGVAMLGVLVDQEGRPANIEVMTPIGCGLDEKAVQFVRTWKFDPAEKDGQPVRFEVAIEVDFHLY